MSEPITFNPLVMAELPPAGRHYKAKHIEFELSSNGSKFILQASKFSKIVTAVKRDKPEVVTLEVDVDGVLFVWQAGLLHDHNKMQMYVEFSTPKRGEVVMDMAMFNAYRIERDNPTPKGTPEYQVGATVQEYGREARETEQPIVATLVQRWREGSEEITTTAVTERAKYVKEVGYAVHPLNLWTALSMAKGGKGDGVFIFVQSGEGEEVGVNVRKQDLQDVLAHFKHYTSEPVHLRFCTTTTLALSHVERTRFQDRTVIEVATKWEQLPVASLVVDGHKCQFTFKAQEVEPVVRVELVITE